MSRWCAAFSILILILCTGAVAWGQHPEDHEDAKTDPKMAELFDGKELIGWEVEGDHTIKDGLLIIGGTAAAKLRPKTSIGNKFKLLLEAEYHGPRPQWIVQTQLSPAPKATDWVISADRFYEIVLINNPKSPNWEHEVRLFFIGPQHQGMAFAGIGRGSTTGLEIGIPAGARLSIRRLRWYSPPASEPTSAGMWMALGVLGLLLTGVIALGWWLNRRRSAISG